MRACNIIVLLLLVSLPLIAQDNNQNTGKVIAGGSAFDERIQIKNFFYWKKYAPSGRGEFLEISFDAINHAEYNIPLKMFIVGFYEHDETDSLYRKYVSYPQWRSRDFEAEVKKIALFDSVPKLDHEEVANWAAKNRGEDPQPEAKTESEKRKRKTAYQRFLDYVSYIEAHPDKGIDVPLQGWEDTTTLTSKEAEYNIVSISLKTSVWATLYSRYRQNPVFFNHLGVVLYDMDEKKVVYRQFIKFTRPFRIR